MTRLAKFERADILDAALALVAERGPTAATMGRIAKSVGAPSGSIYHRFASRDLLLAHLWIRTAHRAQAGFIRALAASDANHAAEAAAVHLPRWSRRHLDEARLMLLYRRQDLAAQWPDELGKPLQDLQNAIDDPLRGLVRRKYGRETSEQLRLVTFCLIDVPYAAVRRYLLQGKPPPKQVDEFVLACCHCLLS